MCIGSNGAGLGQMMLSHDLLHSAKNLPGGLFQSGKIRFAVVARLRWSTCKFWEFTVDFRIVVVLRDRRHRDARDTSCRSCWSCHANSKPTMVCRTNLTGGKTSGHRNANWRVARWQDDRDRGELKVGDWLPSSERKRTWIACKQPQVGMVELLFSRSVLDQRTSGPHIVINY